MLTLIFLVGFLISINAQAPQQPYLGTFIGSFKNHLHGVTGNVFAVDENTIFIQDFNYDGQGPDAYFWMGSTTKPDTTGIIIPDEKGSTKPLGAYTNKNLVLRLPEGKSLRDIKWISVWCRKFNANFGDLFIPRRLDVPSPVEIAPLSQLDHGLKSGPITIVDAQTFLIPGFHYDGQGPAGYWWATRGRKQGPSGTHLSDENGTKKPLRRYSGETVVISLPDGKTIWDYDFLGVWCEKFNVDFGHTRIPQNVKVPPSPRMLGIKPESKLNCEVLNERLGLEVRWVMDGDDIVIQLVGKIGPNEYMAFGLGKDDGKSNMINADATVTWFDQRTGRGYAVDYFLDSKQQCVGSRGSCPDVKFNGGTESNSLLHAAVVDQYTMVTFKRPQLGVDDKYDQHVYSDGQQAVIWAVGPINDRNEVSYHRARSSGDLLLDFARSPKWNCPNPDSRPANEEPVTRTTPISLPPVQPNLPAIAATSPAVNPKSQTITTTVNPKASGSSSSDVWEIPPVICPVDNVFRAQIGPTGGKKGYEGITGRVGWGISWYINGLLIPELTVQRGRTYTFIVEGGNDQQNAARRHPLYITDSEEGGFEHKTKEERKKERIFAGVGVTQNGELIPTAEGRICNWRIDTNAKEQPDEFKDFFSFQRTLNLDCQQGEPGFLQWTPDYNTPDVVYYQCFTHRYLGWKIRVVDSCDYLASSSIENPSLISVNQNVTLTKPKKVVKVKNPKPKVVAPPKHSIQKPRVPQQQQLPPVQPQYQRAYQKYPQNINNQNRQKHQNVHIRNIASNDQVGPHIILPPHKFESSRLNPQMMPPQFIQHQPFVTNPVENYMPPMYINRQEPLRKNQFVFQTPVMKNTYHPYQPPSARNSEDISLATNLQTGFLPLLINSKNNSSSQQPNLKELKAKEPKKSITYKEGSYQQVSKPRGSRRKLDQTKPIAYLPKQTNKSSAIRKPIPHSKQLTTTIIVTQPSPTTQSSFLADDIRRNPITEKTTTVSSVTTTAPKSPDGIEDVPVKVTEKAEIKKKPLITITSNGTDNAILSHIMSLIAENAAPPEIKITSERLGTQASTHVEIHHRPIVKRSTNEQMNNQYQKLNSDSIKSNLNNLDVSLASSANSLTLMTSLFVFTVLLKFIY